ncbi:MAG: cyclophilin-like fold protein [Limnochordia bacterium]|jgi:hypothetical protein
MAREIIIQAGSVTVEAELYDNATADAIWNGLPIEARGNRWGEEIYFSIPVKAPVVDPHPVVELGELAFWPPGNAFCIFFGPTPASMGDECRAASAVSRFGRIKGDALQLTAVRSGEKVTVKKKE